MSIERRAFLKYAAAGCACCATAKVSDAVLATENHGKSHWSYEGEKGPEHWGELSPEYKICQLGVEQTPIDLTDAVAGDAGEIAFDYRPLPLRLINNGHTVQVNAEPSCTCTIAGTPYRLVQFHFHHPSEHRLDGKAFEMEVHFVHKSEAGALAVVGVFFRAGAHNAGLQPIFDQMPKSEGPEIAVAGSFDPVPFLPLNRGYFRYRGSLTTPPCFEGLTWTVFREPVEASPEQIRQFSSLFPNNARPIQRKNRRFLLEVNS